MVDFEKTLTTVSGDASLDVVSDWSPCIAHTSMISDYNPSIRVCQEDIIGFSASDGGAFGSAAENRFLAEQKTQAKPKYKRRARFTRQ